MLGVHRVTVVYSAHGGCDSDNAPLQIHVAPLQGADFTDAQTAAQGYHYADVLSGGISRKHGEEFAMVMQRKDRQASRRGVSGILDIPRRHVEQLMFGAILGYCFEHSEYVVD